MRRLRGLSAALLFAGALIASAPAPPAAAGPPEGFTAALVQGGLAQGAGGLATAFAMAPDGRVFVARKQGVIDVWDTGTQHVFLDLRAEVNSAAGRGLLGLALDPAFTTNHRVFALFTQELDPEHPHGTGPAGGEIVSIEPQAGDPDAADPATRVTLLSGYESISTQHSVGGLGFDAQGNLLATFGDAADDGVHDGAALAALDLDDLRGKLVRIDPNTGLGVPGNPYYDAAQPDSVGSRIYARGFRNAYRFSVDPDNGTVYVGDVGWNTWEMLNAFPTTFTNADRDRNAGWPCYEGGDGVALPQPDFEYAPVSQAACQTVYSPDQGGTGVGAAAPLYGYRHDDPGGENGSAITAGPKYTGTSNYPAQYDGQLFVGDYARDRFQTVDPTTGVATDFGTEGEWGNPVDIQIAPDGNVAYLAISTGELREIVYTGSNHPPTAVASAAATSSPTAPFTAELDGSGSFDPDPGDTLTYDWNFADGSPHSTEISPEHEFTAAGSYDVTLTVSDGHPGGTVATHLWIDVANTPPTVTLTSPSPSFRYRIGSKIKLELDAQDAEDGHLPASRISTEVRLIHLDHFHPIVDFTGSHAQFTVTDHNSDATYYEIVTTVTDRFGRPTTGIFDILPDKQPVSITSNPPGAVVSVDGVQATTPYDFASIVNEHHEVDAPADLTVGSDRYTFDHWTQGAATASTEFYAFDTPATGTALDAEYSPTAQGLSVSDASIAEGKTATRAVTLDVSLSGPASGPVTVDYVTHDGIGTAGATAPSDYLSTAGTLTFAPGTITQAVSVPVVGDAVHEPDETFTVALSNAAGAPIVRGTGTVTILNDDPGGGLQLRAGDTAVLEGDAGPHDAAVAVTLSAPSPTAVTVDYATSDGSATAPTDYRAVSGTLTFAAGVTTQTVHVPVNGDGEFEPSEALSLQLSDAVGARLTRPTGTIRIANDDPGPALSIGDVASVEGDQGRPQAFFAVTLSTPSPLPVTVGYAVTHVTTNDGDLVRRTGSVTLPPGRLSTTLHVDTFADTTVEPDETYAVTLSDPVNATIARAVATGTILNDDPGLPLRIGVGDASVVEGNSGNRHLSFTVTLSGPAAVPIPVVYATADGTARAGHDYRPALGTVLLAPGQTSAAISVDVRGDALVEPDETFTVTLADPGPGLLLGRATGTGTILDDD